MKYILLLPFLVLAVANMSAQTWSAMGTGMNGDVTALAEYNGELYAGGAFTQAGGVTANRIAKWNGTNWQAVGTGMSGTSSTAVMALAVYNGELYAGGWFTTAGGIPVNNIARWNGTTWSAVGTGIAGPGSPNIYALCVHNGLLYASGVFTSAGGVAANYIAQWNGSAWSAIGSGLNDAAKALTVYNGELIAGGWFTTAGGIPANKIAKWNGSSWANLSTGITTGTAVFSLGVYNSELYAGGVFTNAGTVAANNIAKWNGSNWSAPGSGVSATNFPDVRAIAVYNNELYAGGYFSNAGGVAVSHIARWNGTAWAAVSTGVNNSIYSALATSSELYIGGGFTTAGGSSASKIAKWTTCTSTPPVPASIAGSTNVCANSIQTYTVSPVGGATSYVWTLPAGWTGTSTTNSITVTAGSSSGAITVASANACGTSAPQTLTVSAVAAPTASITAAGPTTFCQGGSVTLNANSGINLSYQWKLNGTNINGATNASFLANQSGSYTVNVTSGSCSSTSPGTTVTVHPLPTPTIVQAGNNLSISSAFASYQWYLNGSPLAGATNQSYPATQNGNYHAVVTDNNNCTGQSNTLSVVVSDISNVQIPSSCPIYPNPNNGRFFVNGFRPMEKIHVEVMDPKGCIIFKEHVIAKDGGALAVSVNYVATGLYVLQATTGEKRIVIPFFIQQ